MDCWRWLKIYFLKTIFIIFLAFISIEKKGFTEIIPSVKKISTLTSEFVKNNEVSSFEKEDLDSLILDTLSLGDELFTEENTPNEVKVTDWTKGDRKLFGDNPTVRYQSFFLSDSFEYVITGSLKDLEFITFQMYSLKGSANIPTNIVSSNNFKYVENNNFELIVSAKKYLTKDSLEIASDDYIIIMREFYRNDLIKNRFPSTLKVKKNYKDQNKKKNQKKMKTKKRDDFVEGVIISTFDLYEKLQENFNSEIDEKYKIALFPTKGNYYEGETVELNDDEIYEITVYNLPENFKFIWTFYNIFSRTPDYKKYKVYLNNYDIKYEAENTYKFYLSKYKIDNLINSIETGGYSRGILSLRISEENIPDDFDYTIKKVKINQIN